MIIRRRCRRTFRRTRRDCIRARDPDGAVWRVGCSRNHDWWLDAPRVGRALESAGIPVLEDSAVSVGRGDCRFWVAGISDFWEGRHDVAQALARVPGSESVPVVPSIYAQRYAVGHIVEQNRHLFVSAGLGTSIIPVRFLVPPEISILTLRSTQSSIAK